MAQITLIVTGGIAAYKALELTRLLRGAGHGVTPILTRHAENFVTPLSFEALAESPVHTDLFAPGQESTIGHIRLARDSDLVVVAPASADFLAKMAQGRCDDLASTVLLANTAPVLVAPAMNHRMWSAPATRQNMALLRQRGVGVVGPGFGDMACGEYGEGRLEEPAGILARITGMLAGQTDALAGVRVVVTGGPTHEPIDPVRYLGNRSSGKQARAIASAFVQAGAEVVLIHGPMAEAGVVGGRTRSVTTALEMQAAVAEEVASGCGVLVAAAAVADWRVAARPHKYRKAEKPSLELIENPDILAEVAGSAARPTLVIGFAAETDDLLESAEAKLRRKGCDWLLANKIDRDNPAFGMEDNHLYALKIEGDDVVVEDWGSAAKTGHAARLVESVCRFWHTDRKQP